MIAAILEGEWDPLMFAQHAAQLHVHLDQRLLHALNRTAGLRHQVPSLPPFFTADLRQMARWLVEKGVRSVAMKLPAFGLLQRSRVSGESTLYIEALFQREKLSAKIADR